MRDEGISMLITVLGAKNQFTNNLIIIYSITFCTKCSMAGSMPSALSTSLPYDGVQMKQKVYQLWLRISR